MDIINKFLAFENKNYFLKKIQKKIARVFNIYFIPTSLNALPENNYSMKHDINYQKELIEKFKKTNSISSFNTYPKILEKLVILFPDKNSHFNFLDFGGENIDFYLIIKKYYKNMNYYIHNTNEVNAIFIKLKKNENLKNFIILKDINEIKANQYDFVNFGSVMQYVNNYKEILSDISKVSKKFIFISGTHFYNSNENKFDKLVVKQVNLLPTKFYCYFFSYDPFIKIFKDRKFSVIEKTKNTTDEINYSNFKNFSNILYTDLLLSK